MGSKVNDKFDIQCFDELTTNCSKWFHSSCLSTKFKIKKREINAMANTLDAIDWTCPICNDSKSDCDDNKDDEDMDMEEYSDENTNNSNTNTPRRNSSNSSNSARLTRRNNRNNKNAMLNDSDGDESVHLHQLGVTHGGRLRYK
eukprot:494507_1